MNDTLAGKLGVPTPSFVEEDNLDCLLVASDLPCRSFRSMPPFLSFHSIHPSGYYNKGVAELLFIFLHMAAAFIDTYYSEEEFDGNTLAGLHSKAPAAYEDCRLDTIHN